MAGVKEGLSRMPRRVSAKKSAARGQRAVPPAASTEAARILREGGRQGAKRRQDGGELQQWRGVDCGGGGRSQRWWAGVQGRCCQYKQSLCLFVSARRGGAIEVRWISLFCAPQTLCYSQTQASVGPQGQKGHRTWYSITITCPPEAV